MPAWKWLFGILGATGVAMAAAAAPPMNPLVDGREPDPVARQFHEPDRVYGGYVAPVEPAAPSTWVSIGEGLWELMLDRLTFPLGTAVPTGENLGG